MNKTVGENLEQRGQCNLQSAVKRQHQRDDRVKANFVKKNINFNQ